MSIYSKVAFFTLILMVAYHSNEVKSEISLQQKFWEITEKLITGYHCQKKVDEVMNESPQIVEQWIKQTYKEFYCGFIYNILHIINILTYCHDNIVAIDKKTIYFSLYSNTSKLIMFYTSEEPECKQIDPIWLIHMYAMYLSKSTHDNRLNEKQAHIFVKKLLNRYVSKNCDSNNTFKIDNEKVIPNNIITRFFILEKNIIENLFEVIDITSNQIESLVNFETTISENPIIYKEFDLIGLNNTVDMELFLKTLLDNFAELSNWEAVWNILWAQYQSTMKMDNKLSRWITDMGLFQFQIKTTFTIILYRLLWNHYGMCAMNYRSKIPMDKMINRHSHKMYEEMKEIHDYLDMSFDPNLICYINELKNPVDNNWIKITEIPITHCLNNKLIKISKIFYNCEYSLLKILNIDYYSKLIKSFETIMLKQNMVIADLDKNYPAITNNRFVLQLFIKYINHLFPDINYKKMSSFITFASTFNQILQPS